MESKIKTIFMKKIIFLHAFPLNSKMWKYQIQGLKEKFDIYTPDYQNLGKENLKDYADYIYNFCKENGIEKAIFVGLSMGGYIIFQLLRYYKEIIEGIVLANTKAIADNEEAKKRRYEMIERIEKDGTTFLEDFYIDKFLKNRSLESENLIREMIKEAKKESIIAMLKALATREDSTDLLKEISIPTLIIAGMEDELTTLEDAKIMHENIKNSKLIIFENCKHLSNLEYPDKFNESIIEFLK